MPLPIGPTLDEIDNSQPFTSSQCVDEDDDSEFQDVLTKPHLITQGDINDLVRNLNLAKKTVR